MGTNQRIITKRLFDFSKVAGSQNQEIIVARNIPAHLYREASILFRYHGNNGTSWIAGQQIDAVLRSEAPTDEDPNTDFVYATDLATASVYSTTAAPYFVIQAAQFGGNPGNIGSHLRVVLRGTQPAAPATLQAFVSLDLSLKG